ncbi:28065_t:CDS:2, partial [Racocetra persica]
GDISLFRRTLDSPNNFLIVDAQALTFKYKAYMILLTSPKVERFNEAVKWPGFTQYFMPIWDHEEIITLWDLQYKNKKNEEGEEFTLELVGELLDKWGPIPSSGYLGLAPGLCIATIVAALVAAVALVAALVATIALVALVATTVALVALVATSVFAALSCAISSRLVHLDPVSKFTSTVYCFASPRVFDRVIQEYEIRTKRNARDLIMNSHEFLKIAGFQGNMFEDFAYRELQNGAHKEYYNRPKSKTFASIDSFSLDSKTLDLYQITVSTNHGMKIKGLNDLDCLLAWRKDMNNFNLYFVVPPDIFGTFPLQRYKTTKDKDCQKILGWINNITQYALEINLGISNKGVKKQSSDAMSGDDENEETTGKGMNKD